VAHARKKIASKNLDWIVLNSLSESGSGFQVDTNRITILDAQGGVQEYPLKSKEEVANDIVQKITEAYSDV
jgi:phosphopantothenoylcysteine decarboxylase/phosphopantothenate--cysteine ligase